jgi:hypothetical protein
MVSCRCAATCLAVLAVTANAAVADSPLRPEIVRTGAYPDQLVSGEPGAGAVYLYGGPSSQEGKFETAAGVADWQGWYHVDLSTSQSVHWHVDTYNCQNLDPIPDNHAWWCGGPILSECDPGGNGYGPDWNEYLGWTGYASPGTDVTVHVTAFLNHDLEQDHDILQLGWWSDADAAFAAVATWTGFGAGLHVDETFVVPAADLGPSGEVRLRWWVQTDLAVDGYDCGHKGTGAAQIDDIVVTFDQGGGPITMSVEDCETGYYDWTGEVAPAVGDFAHILDSLDEPDPCRDNATPQVVFIDDGVVVPGTGGTTPVSWFYGPSGYCVNNTGGLLGPGHGLHNQVESPELYWDRSQWDSARLEFDVFAHLPLGDAGVHTTICYYWAVRGVSAADQALIQDLPWHSDGRLYACDDPVYLHQSFDISHLVPENTMWVQIALGVVDVKPFTSYTGEDPTPAPYFDNVSLVGWNRNGPALVSWERNQAQDAFTESGIIDLNDLSLDNVRFDAALNLMPVGNYPDPGDSLVVAATPSLPGAVLTSVPRMHYLLQRNPLFDPYRTSGLPDEGDVDGDSAFAAPGVPWQGRFSFDLPDTGFLYPGDVLHYFFVADEDPGGWLRTSLLPADTTGFGGFGDLSRYPVVYTMRALPSLSGTEPADRPYMLFWNDYGSGGGEDEWRTGLDNLGFRIGVDYDIYTTKDPLGAHGNGLGGRATLDQIADCGIILYSSGNAASVTLSDGFSAGDGGDDVTLLESWLDIGNRHLFATGNHLISDMSAHSMPGGFVATWFGVGLHGDDVAPEIGDQTSPDIIPLAGNPVLWSPTLWRAHGGCDVPCTFDDVFTAPIPDATQLAGYVMGAPPSVYPNSSAGTLYVNPSNSSSVLSLPYDLMRVWDPAKAPVPAAERTRILDDVLVYFGLTGPYAPDRVPSLDLSTAVTAAPDTVSLCILPDGSGDGPGEGYLRGGARTPASITVTLLDASGVPVADYPAEDLWLQGSLGSLVLCSGGSIADANTTLDGTTTFSGPLRGGGHLATGEVLQVYVAGAPLSQPGFAIRVNGCDIDGDADVDSVDFDALNADDSTGYAYQSDFYWDGVIDLSDYILCEEGKGATCK